MPGPAGLACPRTLVGHNLSVANGCFGAVERRAQSSDGKHVPAADDTLSLAAGTGLQPWSASACHSVTSASSDIGIEGRLVLASAQFVLQHSHFPFQAFDAL